MGSLPRNALRRGGPLVQRGVQRQKMHQLRHRAVVWHIGRGQARHAAALGFHQRDGAALKIAGQQKHVEGVHKRRHVVLHAGKEHAVLQPLRLHGGAHLGFHLAGAHQQQFPRRVGCGQRRKDIQQEQRVFLVVDAPHKPGQAVGPGHAVPRAHGGARRRVGVEAALVHGVAGHGKVGFLVDVRAEHKAPGRHAAPQEIIGKALVDQVRRVPGQRQRRVDDVAVYDDLGARAERAHHAAHRRADLAGGVVVDDVIVLVRAQVGPQRADAVLFMVGHRKDLHARGLQRRGGAGLVRRALPHEQIDLVARKVQVQKQVLHIALHAALHAQMVADHQNAHSRRPFFVVYQ